MADGLKRLTDIHQKSSRLILGLMSGTSHDAVDAALVEIKGKREKMRARLIHHYHHPFTNAIRNKIKASFSGPTRLICSLNFELAEVFSEAAILCLKESGIKPSEVDAIASHGQTIYHMPPEKGRMGSTLQIGSASVIAERTGILVVSNFRNRDMAAQGEGAPLVPYADYLLFHKKGKNMAIQNIGGIANVTLVTEAMEDVIAFDTGPGNSLIDEAVKVLTNGRLSMDVDGRLAYRGELNKGLLDELLSHPYLRKQPPKSTGREVFGQATVADITRRYHRAKKEDIIKTLTVFTARSIYDAYRRFIFPKVIPDEVVLCGGGSKNPFLTGVLTDIFKPIPIRPIEAFGIPSSAKEAMCFAILANETLSGIPCNLPQVTGAERQVILGDITL